MSNEETLKLFEKQRCQRKFNLRLKTDIMCENDEYKT